MTDWTGAQVVLSPEPASAGGREGLMKCTCVGGLGALGLKSLGFQNRNSAGFPGDSTAGSGISFAHLVDLLSCVWVKAARD